MEAAVADAPITERQKFWRDHVLAAAAFDGTIVEYAKANNLKTKDIYQWKTSLTKRGLLDRGEKKRSDDFVVVAPVATKQKTTKKPNRPQLENENAVDVNYPIICHALRLNTRWATRLVSVSNVIQN